MTALPAFRLGTRGSALALAQSGMVADSLRGLGATVELVTIRTAGDDRPPDATWGEGAFVGAIETAILEARVDFAVHSAKDVPTEQDGRLVIAAYPRREDPHDALVGREPGLTLETLPSGARVGTDSPRRSTFLRIARPDLQIHPLHGNVDTRLRRLDSGETDALVLAVAGLTRLGLADRIGQVLPAGIVPPAPGQGSLALQCRSNDALAIEWLGRLDDPDTRAAVEAERAFLAGTGGGCRAPIGALASVADGELRLVAGTGGRDIVEDSAVMVPRVAWGAIRGPTADRLDIAARLAAELTAELVAGNAAAEAQSANAALTLDSSTTGATSIGRGRVLVTRPEAQAGPLVTALARAGFTVTAIPTIEIQAVQPGGELDAALLSWDGTGWIAVTSANGATAVLDAARRLDVHLSSAPWAAVGDATRAALEARGIHVAFVPSVANGERLAAELPLPPGTAVLLPRGDRADSLLVARLEARGARVTAVTAYRTIQGPETSRQRLRAYFSTGAPDAIVFSSGSAVAGLLALLGASHRAVARHAPACCIGERTAAAARTTGFERIVSGTAAGPAALVAQVETALLVPTEVTR